MVYTPGGNNQAGANVYKLFMQDELGYDLAVLLAEIIPECCYANSGKKILITDVINQEQIPKTAKIYSSETFIVSLEEKQEAVELFIFQRPGK